jgi:flagellar motor switch protein FliM
MNEVLPMPLENVLTRKLREGGVARSPLPETELLGATFARMVEDRLRPVLKTVLAAQVTACRVTKLREALQGIGVPAMLGLIEIEEADTPGLLNIDADLAYHLIDVTLGGDPASAPQPSARSFTGIDMAITRIHLEALLGGLGEAVSVCFGRPLKRAIRLRDQRQNISQFRLAPDYIDILMLSLELEIGEAARRGRFDLILPLSTLDVIRAAIRDKDAEAARDRPNDLWKVLMRRAAASAPVAVDAVLHRRRMTLAQLHALAPGQVLEIPESAPDEVEITIAQPGGKTATVALGRLGAYAGNKVVKLATPPDRRLVEHVRRALSAAPRPGPAEGAGAAGQPAD